MLMAEAAVPVVHLPVKVTITIFADSQAEQAAVAAAPVKQVLHTVPAAVVAAAVAPAVLSVMLGPATTSVAAVAAAVPAQQAAPVVLGLTTASFPVTTAVNIPRVRNKAP